MTHDDFNPETDAWRSIAVARHVKLQIQQAVTAERDRCLSIALAYDDDSYRLRMLTARIRSGE